MIFTILANSVAHEGLAVPGLGVVHPCGMLYHGRAVWPSYEAAYRYLRWCPDIERSAVWAMRANWFTDTYRYQDEPFNRTLHTLHVIAPPR